MPQAEYKHLYNSKAWKHLRQQVFIRDGYICKVCGKSVRDDYRHPHAAIGNHIVKHNGDPALFYDPDNLETVGKSCHDGHIQSLEKGGAGRNQVIGNDGWPVE